MSKIGLSK